MSNHRFPFIQKTLLYVTVSAALLLVLFGIMQSAGVAWGAALFQPTPPTVPPFLNYQGTLRDAEGNPISGVHKLTFRIYADVTAPLPEAVWMEAHEQVTVRNGHFSVLLGDSQPISPTIFQSPDRFIGITLDALDEMVPRQRFAAQPYAFQADNADTVDGLHAQAFALAGHVHAQLSAPDGTPADAVIVNNDGNVGVGTTEPQLKFHVAGSGVRVQSGNRAIDLRADLGAVDLMSPNADLYISSQGGNRNVIINHTGGRVGVNTPNPSTTLDVNGDLHVQGSIRFGGANKPPVLIRRYSDLGQDVTIPIDGISATEYDCTVGAWSIRMDVDEDDEGPYTMWTFVQGNAWMLRARHWTDAAEENKVDVLCFLSGVISEFQGDRNDPGFN